MIRSAAPFWPFNERFCKKQRRILGDHEVLFPMNCSALQTVVNTARKVRGRGPIRIRFFWQGKPATLARGLPISSVSAEPDWALDLDHLDQKITKMGRGLVVGNVISCNSNHNHRTSHA